MDDENRSVEDHFYCHQTTRDDEALRARIFKDLAQSYPAYDGGIYDWIESLGENGSIPTLVD